MFKIGDRIRTTVSRISKTTSRTIYQRGAEGFIVDPTKYNVLNMLDEDKVIVKFDRHNVDIAHALALTNKSIDMVKYNLFWVPVRHLKKIIQPVNFLSMLKSMFRRLKQESKRILPIKYRNVGMGSKLVIVKTETIYDNHILNLNKKVFNKQERKTLEFLKDDLLGKPILVKDVNYEKNYISGFVKPMKKFSINIKVPLDLVRHIRHSDVA